MFRGLLQIFKLLGKAFGGFNLTFTWLRRKKLLAIDRHIAWCFYPQSNFATVYVNHRYANILTDVYFLSKFSAEDQHLATLLRANSKLCVINGVYAIILENWQEE